MIAEATRSVSVMLDAAMPGAPAVPLAVAPPCPPVTS